MTQRSFAEPFVAPRLKIARAREHIGELERRVSEFIASTPIKIVVTPSPGDPEFVDYALVSTAEYPLDLAAILGDAIHNLRAALDLLANDLVRLQGESTKGVSFPFAKDKEQLETRIKERRFHLAGAQAVSLLRKLRPFEGGDVVLCAVHGLDIQDKHQMLVPSLGAISHAIGGVGVPALTLRPGKVLQHGSARLDAYAGRGLVLGESPAKFRLMLMVRGMSGTDLIPTVRIFEERVSSVVAAFEAVADGKEPPPEVFSVMRQVG